MIKGLTLKYFVLDPTKRHEYGEASRKAILAYARSIETTNTQLAFDLKRWEIGCRHNITQEDILSRAEGNFPKDRTDDIAPNDAL